jgi:hypothetical protein
LQDSCGIRLVRRIDDGIAMGGRFGKYGDLKRKAIIRRQRSFIKGDLFKKDRPKTRKPDFLKPGKFVPKDRQGD